MQIRWVALNLAGQRVGDPFFAEDKQHAYDRGCALYGPACLSVQSLLSWEQAQEDLSIEARNKRRRRRDFFLGDE